MDFLFFLISLFQVKLPAIVLLISSSIQVKGDSFTTISRSTWDEYYDYIIVGAGASGCVIANRLSENPHVKILLLEAGGSESAISDIPQTVFFLQQTPMDWAYRSEPQTHCCLGIQNRQTRLASGKALGGGTAINNMLYVRGNRRDYDNWADMGATGWSYNEVLPYFIKSEDNHEKDLVQNGYHGVAGPLSIERSSFLSPLVNSYLEGASKLGWPIVDYNGPNQIGVAISQNTMQKRSRCSAAKAFLLPIKNRPNLHVVTFAYVKKILFNEYREAYGVLFDRFNDRNNRVIALREVILSAGAVKTPQLLMLSGIGPRYHLQSLGIPVLADLPVGNNLGDHAFVLGLNFLPDERLRPPNAFWTHILSRVNTPQNTLQYLLTRTGPIASNTGIDGIGFLRTNLADKRFKDRPDIQIQFTTACLSSDSTETTRRNFGVTDQMWHQVFEPFVETECFTIYPILLHPRSRGYVRLRNRDPYQHPIIDLRYLTDPFDIEVLAQGLMLAYEIGLSEPFRRNYNIRISDRVIPGCEMYAMYSLDYMKCMARTLTVSLWHFSGTSRMGQPNDPKTVVDPLLRVKGVKRLRVADASIMPTLPSGNTQAASMMIGEKASDIIKGIYRTPNVGFINYVKYYYGSHSY